MLTTIVGEPSSKYNIKFSVGYGRITSWNININVTYLFMYHQLLPSTSILLYPFPNTIIYHKIIYYLLLKHEKENYKKSS